MRSFRYSGKILDPIPKRLQFGERIVQTRSPSQSIMSRFIY
jgi:hypothetical protein